MAQPAEFVTSTSQRMIEQTTNEQLSWKYLFAQFLKLSAAELDQLQISFANDELSVIGLTQAQVANLQEILRSPEAVKSNIGYTLQPIIRGVVTEIPPLQARRYPDAIQPRANIAINVYQHLFSAAFLRRCGSLEWSESSPLMLEARVDAELKDLSVQQIRLIKQKLGFANFFQLRKAFSAQGHEHLPDSPAAGMSQDGAITDHLDKIIYMREKDEGATAYFDLNLLLQCVTAPVPEVRAVASAAAQERFCLTFSKNHLLAYLTTVFGEFVLHTPASATEQTAAAGAAAGPAQAVPLFLNMQPGVRRKVVYALLLDVSDSMRNRDDDSVFVAYIEKVRELMVNIFQRTAEGARQQDEVRITLFGTYVLPTTVFKLSEIASIHNSLTDIPARIARGQGTRLKGGIQRTLQELSTLENINECNVVFVILTDGFDNVSTSEEVRQLHLDLNRHRTNPRRPQFITVAVGDADLDTLNNLAELGGGDGMEAISLKGGDDFNPIYQSVTEMDDARRVFAIFSGKDSFAVHAREGSIAHHPRVRVTVPGVFSVDGKEFSVTAGGQPVLELAPLAAAPAGVAGRLPLFRTSRAAQGPDEQERSRHRSGSVPAHSRTSW